MVLKVYIGADHRGVNYKKKISDILAKLEYDVIDVGAFNSSESCDYPKVAKKVAKAVAKSTEDRGILVCMSGVGQAIAANKVKGVYAALCYNVQVAKLSRQHNNSNVLVLSSKFTKQKDLPKIIKTWLTTDFEGGRHLRRLNQIKALEKGK